MKHFQVAKCKIFIVNAGMQPPKSKFRFKKGLEYEAFGSSQNAKFSYARGRGTPIINLYIKTKNGLKIKHM